MITINIIVDHETKNYISKKFPKLWIKKCKSASYESLGFRGDMIEAGASSSCLSSSSRT
nr:MAG TPA: hypothetical protein [Caudoviricetes sp.]